MAKYIDKTQEEWDALIDKWHTTDDIKCSLQEYLELDDIEYLRLIHNITDPTVSDEDVLKISRNTVKEVVAELAIKPKLKELEQAIKSALVDEPEKTRDDAAYVLLCSFIANNPTFSAYLSLPKELEEKVKEYREYKIAENIVAPDPDAQEMPTIDDLCNALEKQGKKDLSDKIRSAQNQ